MENKVNQNLAGLNLDNVNWQVQDNMVTYALNANVQGYDGESLTYTNEPSNQSCYRFDINKPGFKIVGNLPIIEQDKLIVFLTHEDGRSEIGEITYIGRDCESINSTEEDCGCPEGTHIKSTVETAYILDDEPVVGSVPFDSCCRYKPLITDNCTGFCQPGSPNKDYCCLNFSLEYPVQAIYRIDECKTRVYFISENNPPRRFVIEEPLGVDSCQEPINCVYDGCEGLNLFPKYCHPEVHPIAVESGGSLRAGVYSFAIAYADQDGQEITDYHDLTNPIPIFERAITEQTAYITSKSIKVRIEHKDEQFKYFNLIVAEATNELTEYHLVGTYRVSNQLVDEVIYTGDYKSTFSGIFPLIRTPYYESAGIIEKQNDILMLANVNESPKYNLQPFANKLELFWETVEMPADGRFDYSNPEIAYFFRTYQRDEVYPFGIKFKLKNGKYTDVFHIPGRAALGTDLDPLTMDDQDVFRIDDDCIVVDNTLPKWKVYNTAVEIGDSINGRPDLNIGTAEDYVEKQFECEVTNSKYGRFSYWESSEKYPCIPEIWEELADQPIRHHKFPDSLVNHIHDGKSGSKTFQDPSKIYPIGVRLNNKLFENLLNGDGQFDSPYTVYDPTTKKNLFLKDLICGYEIVRGNRVNNKSIIAKGLVYDVGKYVDTSTNKSYFYPNYPYNDLGWDRYLANKSSWNYQSRGDIADNLGEYKLDGFAYQFTGDTRYQNRFTFHSPDTSFQYPKIGTELKLETLEYGKVLGHFVPVLDHPEYKYLTDTTNIFAASIGVLAAIVFKQEVGVSAGQSTSVDIGNQVAQTQLIYDIITKLVPYTNFAWQYNSVAAYNNYETIPNANHKRRIINIGRHIDAKISEVEDALPVHNRLRESSVYLRTSKSFQHHTKAGWVDNSRYTISNISTPDIKDNPTLIDSTRKTITYYTSIKRSFPNQYGAINNILYISTGYIVDIQKGAFDNVQTETKLYPAFGGDTYINKFALKRKHSFFTRNLANLPAKVNDMPFDYWLFPNLAYPAYYTGNTPEELSATGLSELLFISGVAVAILITTGAFASNALVAGTAGAAILTSTSVGLSLAAMYSIKSPNVNLDNKTTPLGLYKKGHFYTASYGIPIFFVESDINIDFRHGRDDTKENFYPNVGSEIPDEWLHEINVPIKYDNFYHYNATYSMQNKSPNLPYDVPNPSEDCVVLHPNRVIYSSRASTTRYYSDNWQVFKRGDFYDFPKEGGKLINLTAGEDERVYARFENTTKVYGTRIQLDSTSPVQLEIGDASMFKQKPLDLSKADLGYIGSQHKAQVRTEFGTFWVDAKRGHMYQISKQGFNEIKTNNNYNWFKQNLPFKILKDFPNADIDNPAKGIGITMGWDERFERVFITKLDYKLTGNVSVIYDELTRKYYEKGTTNEVSFSDDNIWENHSWTIAYSPKLKNFVSFYSFTPNYYIPLLGNFQTVLNTDIGSSTWNHNLNPYTYQTYYGKTYPYILEYTANSFPKTAGVNSVSLIQDIQEYYSDYEYYSLGTANNKNLPNFTKAIIYNKEQSSGIINLIPEEFGNTRQKIQYPRTSANGIETLISRRENIYTFNGFWSTTNQSSGQPLWSTKWSDKKSQHPIDKVPNTKTIVPVSVAYQKQKIKSDFCRVRLIQDQYTRYRFINHLQLTQTN